MSIAFVLLLVGLVAGLARGGRLSNIARARFRLPSLVFAGLGIQIAGEVAGALSPGFREGGRGPAVLGISYALLIAFVWLNRRLPGSILIGAGLALNATVILLNGGMPVSLDAIRAAGFEARDYLETAVKHRQLGPDTRLPFLGDVIPLPLLERVISVGDVLLGIGVLLLTERLVGYRPRRSAHHAGTESTAAAEDPAAAPAARADRDPGARGAR